MSAETFRVKSRRNCVSIKLTVTWNTLISAVVAVHCKAQYRSGTVCLSLIRSLINSHVSKHDCMSAKPCTVTQKRVFVLDIG